MDDAKLAVATDTRPLLSIVSGRWKSRHPNIRPSCYQRWLEPRPVENASIMNDPRLDGPVAEASTQVDGSQWDRTEEEEERAYLDPRCVYSWTCSRAGDLGATV